MISAKGLSITATVSDRPAQLNGIDTQYRFHGSQLRIVENEILDFTLSGSGPLPPKLVGDAMADISLQFRQQEGSLKLVAGAAKIQGNKLLDCKGTRFRFSVDAMGLQFVNDEKFHIFFTLTGTARFELQAGDDRKNGALSMLPNIQIDLVDCPLTGDASVALPVQPAPEAAYGLLQQNPDQSVECVRFAWDVMPTQVDLVNPDDLKTEVVRRRAVFKWTDTVRATGKVYAPDGENKSTQNPNHYRYTIQKITQSGSTMSTSPIDFLTSVPLLLLS